MSKALQTLQIAKRQIGLHDDDYRGILERTVGVRSSKGLTDAQIGKVLDVLKREHGWTPTVIQGGKKAGSKGKARPVAEHPTAKKARALWISLWQLGVVRDRSEKALEAFAKKQLKVETMIWADQQQMYKLIEALKAMAERAGWSQVFLNTGIWKDPKARTDALVSRLYEAQLKKLGRDKPAAYYTWNRPSDLYAKIDELAADIHGLEA
ncbi:regulatory protein GemA [Asticcacaulis sp. YBE204]|uniref:regulatory protein GemA n=1 Tax=Asticcacaulis sp. YBE204 TaxID=1282363 RepID=UPI0003C3EC8A|nr:regulatory protein GemA [Asticcacaulis sp. YBE204]ESQ78489.1 hypothetical protein AEYBE204_13120 [Asticcacaulis sp. YBE204]